MISYLYAHFPSEDLAENAALILQQKVSSLHSLQIYPTKDHKESRTIFPFIPVNNLANSYVSAPGLSPGVYAMNTGFMVTTTEEDVFRLPEEKNSLPEDPNHHMALLSVSCGKQQRYLAESICIAMGGRLEH